MRIYKGKYVGSIDSMISSFEKVNHNISTWESLATEGILLDIDYKKKYSLIGLNEVRERIIVNLRDEILKNLIDEGEQITDKKKNMHQKHTH